MYKIYIIEDDNTISSVIKSHIETWGYEAFSCIDFKNILSEFIHLTPHLVLMDISLPFYNGYYWCQEIRKLSKVPIIFISSASDNMNVVMAVNMGADDFIPKPFDLDILTAKVLAMLRRTYDFTVMNSLIEHKSAILNLSDASLSYNDEKIALTKNEYKILKVLLENKGNVISRDILMQKLWESDEFIDENTLTVNITRLRKKLTSCGLIDFITTKKGIGYIIE